MTIPSNNLAGARSNVSALDEYATPEYCTRKLLEVETFNGSIWECACGKGNMLSVLNEVYPHAYGTDISGGVDFLTEQRVEDNIITNPPYKYALEFAKQGLVVARQKVALFLRLNFLEGQSRHSFFKQSPLKAVYVFSKRQTLSATGVEKGGTIAYAWYVWDKHYEGKPYIDWIL